VKNGVKVGVKTKHAPLTQQEKTPHFLFIFSGDCHRLLLFFFLYCHLLLLLFFSQPFSPLAHLYALCSVFCVPDCC